MFVKITEQPSLYDNLENKSVSEIIHDINAEDKKVAFAVEKVLPEIERLIVGLVERMKHGGRLFYIGAGTSGRLGVIDATEIPPTYGMDPRWVVGVIAGGDIAMRTAVENAEDDPRQGWIDLEKQGVGPLDTLVGIAASGTTPYVIGALKEAREHGLLTAAITSNPGAPITEVAEIAITPVLGPEYVTGSSRMKSASAQKMICNMISTAAMIQLGRVKGNRMINMQITNQKLVDRGSRMIAQELSVPYDEAKTMLKKYGSVKKAVEAYRASSDK